MAEKHGGIGNKGSDLFLKLFDPLKLISYRCTKWQKSPNLILDHGFALFINMYGKLIHLITNESESMISCRNNISVSHLNF